MSLRPYQIDALEKARALVRADVQSVLLCMPTGTGKTRTAVEACVGHVKLQGIPMFVAPRRELVLQASAALAARGLEPGHDVFVRTIQELSMPGAEIPPASMVVLDEARHYVADAWSRLREQLPDAVYLGLDATPERGDGRGLGGMFEELVEAISIRDAIAQGYLVPCETLRPDHALSPGELAQDPVDAYFEKAPGSSAVVFCANVRSAVETAARFSARGVRAAGVFGEMQVSARDHWLAEYERGACKVLCNVHLLTEGWDSPRTETIILTAPSSTRGQLLQRVGRALRPFPGKTRALLLDLAGTTHTHGDPDEPCIWHLDGKAARRAADELDVRFCPVCGGVVDAKVSPMVCAQCGHSGEMRMRKPRVLGLPIDRFARQHAMPDAQAAKALADYMRVAQKRGFKRGWAFHAFEAKYGRKVTPELMAMARAS